MEDSLSVVIIKPFDSECNLGCDYCYMQNILGGQSVMSSRVSKSMINFFCFNREEVEFIWHGGEPLMVGIDFYKKIIQCQKFWLNRGVKIANFIQTNGTLVDQDWASFFSDHGFTVGVSLDGPSSVHNTVRRYKNGRSSFLATMRGVDILRKASVFNGVSCCVSGANYKDPIGTLNFFIENGIKSIKFLRVKGLDINGHPYQHSINQREYLDFLLKIFDQWIAIDDTDLEIRDIKSIVNLFLGGDFRECVYMGRCDKFATVYSDGSIYPCDALPKIPELYFGKVDDNPKTIRESQKIKRFVEILNDHKGECAGSRYINICRSGCLQDYGQSFFKEDSSNSSCLDLQRYYSEIEKKLKKYSLI